MSIKEPRLVATGFRLARLCAVGALVSATAVGCTSARPASPFVSNSCPLPLGARGYPVVAHSPSGRLQPAQLATIARAVISRWDPADSLAFTPPVRALERQITSRSPASRGDWIPAASDTATVAVLLGMHSPARAELLGASEPTDFQRRAWQAVHRLREGLALEGVPLDSMLPGAEISRVVVRFGAEPGASDGVARFAIQERPASVNRATLRTEYPEAARQLGVEASVWLAFIVDARARIDTAQVRIISAPYREFVDAAKQALNRGRFTAAMRDCQLVPVVVTQEFRFSLTR